MTISKQGDKPNSTNNATGRKLTAKQQRFVEEYLVDLNATQAAIRAGYSKKTAEQQAYQLLQKTSVRISKGQTLNLIKPEMANGITPDGKPPKRDYSAGHCCRSAPQRFRKTGTIVP